MAPRGKFLPWARDDVSRYRALAKRQPEIYEPHLALALVNLSVELDRRGKPAPAPLDEAIAIERGLVAAGRATFRRMLASGLLQLSVHHSEGGRLEESLAPAEEALAIIREEAREHDALLIYALSFLGNGLARLGRNEKAVTVLSEAISSSRGIQPHDDVSLTIGKDLLVLARIHSTAGRKSEALRAANEALGVLRGASSDPVGAKGCEAARSMIAQLRRSGDGGGQT